jgi:hypothetical protein
MMRTLFALLVLAVGGRGEPAAATWTITTFQDATCTARETMCTNASIISNDGNCPPGHTMDEQVPIVTHAFVSGECVVKPPDADGEFPFLPVSFTQALEGRTPSSGRRLANNAVKTTCLPGGGARLQWYANADCSGEITGASIDDFFSDTMPRQLAQMPGVGVAKCMHAYMQLAKFNQGMANDGGCDVASSMVYNQVRNRCMQHTASRRGDEKSVAAQGFLVSLSPCVSVLMESVVPLPLPLPLLMLCRAAWKAIWKMRAYQAVLTLQPHLVINRK